MRVKSLELVGFKSFKDKTLIHFDHSITGIVGPNGCGKSNIVDAFFWVMGEQSYKHMRGTKSEDLIFNGSSKFAPIGLAEATLTLETPEVDLSTAPMGASASGDLAFGKKPKMKEISVTRRVFRGGEGEYFLNGMPSRLKDIQELFMDTGVGAKGYSVIEQGQIGKIVNAKPEDRRSLIEEAAGIAKYKARKKESIRKLEQAELNLSRLDDIIRELVKNVESLERQAQKAQKYRDLKNELQEIEVSWGRRRLGLMQRQFNEINARKTSYEQKGFELRIALDQSQLDLEKIRIDSIDRSKAIDEIQNSINENIKKLAEKEAEYQYGLARQKENLEQCDQLSKEVQELERSLDFSKIKEGEIKEKRSELDAELKTLSLHIHEESTKIDQKRNEIESLRVDLESKKSEHLKIQQERAELATKQAVASERMQSLTALMDRMNLRVHDLDKKIFESKELSKKLETTLASEVADLNLTDAKIQELSRTLSITESEEKKAVELVDHYKSQQLTIASRIKNLEAIDRSNQQIGASSKGLLDWAHSQGSNNFDLLGRALNIERGYEFVVASYLEDQGEAILTATEGRELFSKWWNQADWGKISRISAFIPNNLRSEAQAKTEFSTLKSKWSSLGVQVIAPLSQFVSIENVTGLSESIFGRVIVVESIDPFIADPAKIQQANIYQEFIDLKGRIVKASGEIRFGGDEATAHVEEMAAKNVVMRKSEIIRLNEELQKTENDLEIALRRLSEIKNQIESIQKNERELSTRFIQLQSAKQSRTNELERVCSELEVFEKDLNGVHKEQESLQSQIEKLAAELTEAEMHSKTLSEMPLQDEQALRHLDLLVSGMFKELGGFENKLREIMIDEASKSEHLRALERELERQLELYVLQERRCSEVQQLIKRLQNQTIESVSKTDLLAAELKTLADTLHSKNTHYFETKNIQESIQVQIEQLLGVIRETHQRIAESEKNQNDCAIEASKRSSEMSFVTQNLEEKYGAGCLTIGPTSPQLDLEVTEEEEKALQIEVEQIRERIKRLGEVNALAVEEFESLKERRAHLEAEKLDLTHSITTLKAAIEHINVTSADRFQKAFTAISDRFVKLFPIIFGGGRAELTLVYPEGVSDLLECGIDILAQPPGKKVSNITLLSGGEKALTAISLIFAIFMVKPSPFCILDEVDAPLDDSNIGRFNALLKEMSKNTQFILITHNKKTMELNDTLYGVTMEEPGVSKMVSIELQP